MRLCEISFTKSYKNIKNVYKIKDMIISKLLARFGLPFDIFFNSEATMTSVPEGVRAQRKMDYEKLQDVVVRLQSQLIDTRDASRRLENQLNCLLMLVRK